MCGTGYSDEYLGREQVCNSYVVMIMGGSNADFSLMLS